MKGTGFGAARCKEYGEGSTRVTEKRLSYSVARQNRKQISKEGEAGADLASVPGACQRRVPRKCSN